MTVTEAPPPEVETPAAPPPPSFAKTAALITSARAVQTVALFALAPILSRRLSQTDYGTFQHVNALATNLFALLVAAPAVKTITYFLPRTARWQSFLRRTGFLVCAAGLAAGAAFALFPGIARAFDKGDDALVNNRFVIGATIALAFPYSVAEGILIARGAGATFARFMVAQAAWLLLCVGAAVFLAPEGALLQWTLTGLMAAFALQAGVAVWWIWKPAPPAASGASEPSRVLWYALPMALSVALACAGNQFDRFLVPMLYPQDANPEVKSLYLRGAMEIPILGTVAFSMFGLAAPRISALHAAGDTAGYLALWRRVSRAVALASVPAVALAIAVAPDAFGFVFGPKYVAAADVFRWYALVLVMRAFLPNLLLESTGATVRGVWSAASQIVLSVVFALLLIPQFGYVGAAAAMCVSQFVANWLVGGLFAKSAIGCRWRDLLDWGHLLLLSLASGAAAAGAWMVCGMDWAAGLPHVVRAVSGGVVFAALFAGLAPLLRIVSRDDLEALRKLVRR